MCLRALWFWGGLANAGFRVAQGERGPICHCHTTMTVASQFCEKITVATVPTPVSITHSSQKHRDGISAKFSKSSLDNGLK